MINVFLEEIQAAFASIRSAEMTYNENLTDIAFRYLTNATLSGGKSVPPNLKPIMSDREALINAITATHDIHLQIIDNRYDIILSSSIFK